MEVLPEKLGADVCPASQNAYLRPKSAIFPKVQIFSPFGHKQGIDSGHLGLKYRVRFLHASLDLGMFLEEAILLNKST